MIRFVLIFFLSLICTAPSWGQTGQRGYKIQVLHWYPEGYGRQQRYPEPDIVNVEPYTVVEIAPTRDGQVHINERSWPHRPPKIVGPADNEALHGWAEALALRVEDGVLEGYVDRKLIKRNSPLHHDLKTKESILDGRSAIIALIQNNKVMASIRISFAGEAVGESLLPGEIRAPGGPREIFVPDSVVMATRLPPKDWDKGKMDLLVPGLKSYPSGGKPAEMKSVLNRNDISGVDHLPLLFSLLFLHSHLDQTVPIDLGLPIPLHLVGETTLTLFKKIYLAWKFEVFNQETDETLGDTLVHMKTMLPAFRLHMRKMMEDRAYLNFMNDLTQTNMREVLTNPAKRLYRGEQGGPLKRVFTSPCNGFLSGLDQPTFDDLISFDD